MGGISPEPIESSAQVLAFQVVTQLKAVLGRLFSRMRADTGCYPVYELAQCWPKERPFLTTGA